LQQLERNRNIVCQDVPEEAVAEPEAERHFKERQQRFSPPTVQFLGIVNDRPQMENIFFR